MLFGMLQFHFGQKIFGNIGLKKSKENDNEELETNDDKASRNIIVDRLIVIGIFSFVTIFFWWGFEQAGGSMTIFANDYTDRNLVGTGALIFKIVNTLLTIVPMIILTIILYLLFKNTFEKYAVSNIFLASSFVIIWGIVIWMLSREFLEDATEVPASWFAILNSFFIILFAPILSRLWQSKYNPSGPVKFGIGLMLLSFGFAILSFGSINIPLGASTASQSMIFLLISLFREETILAKSSDVSFSRFSDSMASVSRKPGKRICNRSSQRTAIPGLEGKFALSIRLMPPTCW